MSQLFSNDGRSRLVGALTNVATSLTVDAATADLFPIANTTDWLSRVDWFKAVLENNLAQKEIIYVGVRNAGSGIFSNVLRGQEGTTARAYAAGSIVRLSITANDVEAALAIFSGNNEFTGNNEFSGDNEHSGDTNITGTLMQNGVPARTVPVRGVIMWWGEVADIEEGWQLCDGTNGTPDLRDKFVIGARQDDAGAAKTNITGALTTSGGSKDAVLPSHTHGAAVGNQSADHTHTGTTNTTGDHIHSAAVDIGGRYTAAGATGAGAGNTAPAGSHSHTVTTGVQSAPHNHVVTNSTEGVSPTNANLPPYYALAFIACMPYPP